MQTRALALVALSWFALGCGSESDDSPSSGGNGGSGGTTSGGSGGASSGGSAGASLGGSAGSAGSAGSSSGGAAGAPILFQDEFDTEDPKWTFDPTDPNASYDYDAGVLRVSGESLQGFAWYPVDPAWGDDYEVEIRFTIESGWVGGVMVHGEDTNLVNAVNCNLREDLDMLRAARHTERNYLTLNQTPTPVENGTAYTISARVTGADLLTCRQEGGPTVTETPLPYHSGAIGLFVYQGTVAFDSITVRP
jgi:hypothetical protein